MEPRCQDYNCMKRTDELVPYPVYPGSWVVLKLCKACADARRLAWLRTHRPVCVLG